MNCVSALHWEWDERVIAFAFGSLVSFLVVFVIAFVVMHWAARK